MTGSAVIFHHKKLLIGIILIALAGGIGLLLYLRPAVVETDFFVPIETDTDALSITIMTPQSGGVNVRVRGTTRAISRLSQKPVRIHLDNLKPGNSVQTIPLDSQKIELGPDVSVVSIHPSSATIRIEPLIEKKLPVKVVLTGTPAMGFAVTETMVNPDTVRVRGPAGVISAQTQIHLKPVDISGASESFRRLIVLDLPDGVKPIQADPFTINITVTEQTVLKKLTLIPIDGRGAKRIFSISPSSLTLTVKGPFRTVQHLTSNSEFSVYVDLSGLNPGVYVRRAVIVLPVDTVLIKTVPELFTIRIDTKRNKKE
jgi:YbbR domain-containing protein